jgi:hypothetical protein
MEAKDWLPILFERSIATDMLWNFEIVVILGLIVFLAAAGSRLSSWQMRMSVLAGFLAMAGFNIIALARVTEQRVILTALIRKVQDADVLDSLLAGSGPLAPLHVPPLWLVIGVHAFADVLMCALIWWYPGMAHRRQG